jgi:hypothetical protein
MPLDSGSVIVRRLKLALHRMLVYSMIFGVDCSVSGGCAIFHLFFSWSGFCIFDFGLRHSFP